jgi:cytoplasmic iron level regulating protein YaaA (DUF328/UPF0246 family)
MSGQQGKDIVLISCVKSKLTKRCAACEMYTSPLFKKMMVYARRLQPKRIFILSAKYGLLDPTTLIEPYEQTLNKMSAAERRAWAKTVLTALKQQADLDNDHFVFLAGARYREGLLPHIRRYSVPMENLSFGKQLQWLEATHS